MSTGTRSKHRIRRAARPTPKGEAQRGLRDAEVRLRELEQAEDADLETFVSRLNAFLRAARAVPNFLRRELRRNAAWVTREEAQLVSTDARYKCFFELRDVPAHDCIVRPQTAQQSVEVFERMLMRGSVEGVMRDAKTEAPTARFSQTAPVDADSGVSEQVRVSTKYFLKDWPQEDVVTLCKEVFSTLGDLVNRACQKFP